MTQIEALVGLNIVGDIGSIRLKKLLDYYGRPEDIFKAAPEKIKTIAGIGQKIAAKIDAVKKEDIDREFDLAKKYNLRIISLDSKDYPENLRQIPDPPIVLYVKGTLKETDRLGIAVIGSRHASFYGLSLAEKFAGGLSQKGFAIVSGMARGIDTRAHEGALKYKNRTLAVMGSGFGQVYPFENKELAEEISRSGAVISEFPINTKPFPQNFPRRNRIISGLSLGVLVIEAARNSGALITADFALEQGREVFALPGRVDFGNSFGTNALIQQGAKLVSCVDDILEEFNAEINAVLGKHSSKDAPCSQTGRGNQESKEESFLYNLIREQPIHFDEILEKTDIGVAKISQVLMKLQTQKLIKQLPGKQFVRVLV